MPQPRGLAGLRQRTAVATATATSGDSVPVVTVPAELDEAINTWAEAKADITEAEGKLSEAEGRLAPKAAEFRDTACIRAGQVIASIKLQSPTTGRTVMYQQQGRICPIKAQVKDRRGNITDNEQTVRDACGERFDELFEMKTKYVLDEAKLAALPNADAIADALMRALGPHADLLVRESQVCAREQYFSARLGLNGDTEGKRIAEKLEQVERVVKPFSASFR